MERPADALPEGTKLAGYVIGRVLGRGGFGVTYLATDALYPEIKAAIKEFLPEGLAMRRSGDHSVQPSGPGRAEAYRRALASFETEARTLVALRHPNVVEVQRYIEANGTA
ncbi:MAG: protein kinase, partial [Alphaproteobacteria bacterium]